MQWLFDHDTGLLDREILESRYDKRAWVGSPAENLAATRPVRSRRQSLKNMFTSIAFRRNDQNTTSRSPESKNSCGSTSDAKSCADQEKAEELDELELSIQSYFGKTKLFANITRLKE